jgi:hypothetical protein
MRPPVTCTDFRDSGLLVSVLVQLATCLMYGVVLFGHITAELDVFVR